MRKPKQPLIQLADPKKVVIVTNQVRVVLGLLENDAITNTQELSIDCPCTEQGFKDALKVLTDKRAEIQAQVNAV